MRAPSTHLRGVAASHGGLAPWERVLITGVVLLGSVAVGGVYGYFVAWTLAFYVPDEAERALLLTSSILVLILSISLVALRGLGLSRFALSWILVAAASTYLWTSGTFDADSRQQAHADIFGVLAVKGSEDMAAIAGASLTIDGSLVILNVDSAPGTHPLFFVVAPTPPDLCTAYGEFQGRSVYACTAPASIWFTDTASYSWAAPAMQTVGVSILATQDADEVGSLTVEAMPVDVTFETYTPDDNRLFERPLLGNATVDQYTIHYPASAQTVASDYWSAAVEYRLPRGVALLSLARDFSLILLGGAVSLFLMPRGIPADGRAPSLPQATPVADTGKGPTAGHSSLRRPRPTSPRARRGASSAILGSVLTLLTLTVLRTTRPRRR